MTVLPSNKGQAEPEVSWSVKGRALKVAALTCGLLFVVLMSTSLSLEWLLDGGGAWTEALTGFCVFGSEKGLPPFEKLPGCYKAREVAYIRSAAALCMVALLADVIVILLTLVRIAGKDQHLDSKCRFLALGFAAVSLLCAVAALVLCPVGFALDLESSRVTWTLGRGYVVGWAAAACALCELVMQFCDAPQDDEGSTCQDGPVQEQKIQVAVVECQD